MCFTDKSTTIQVMACWYHAKQCHRVSLIIGTSYNQSCQYCFRFVFLNTLRPRQNGRHFADDAFKRIFMNENVRISINISLKFVPKSLINNIPAMVQIMAWRRPGDKPLSEPMMVNLLTHICVTRPQWVKGKSGQYVIFIGKEWYITKNTVCFSKTLQYVKG